MPTYEDLTPEQLDEMPLEERNPGRRLGEKPKSGPWKIIWNTETPTSHTLVNEKEIWINKLDLQERASGTIAHEIAHSKLLKQDIDEAWDRETDDTWFQMGTWREVEAILLTLGKGQATDPDDLGYAIYDSTKSFGDGSARDGKRIVKTIAKRLGKRGFLTKAEVSKTLGIINRYTVNFLETERLYGVS